MNPRRRCTVGFSTVLSKEALSACVRIIHLQGVFGIFGCENWNYHGYNQHIQVPLRLHTDHQHAAIQPSRLATRLRRETRATTTENPNTHTTTARRQAKHLDRDLGKCHKDVCRHHTETLFLDVAVCFAACRRFSQLESEASQNAANQSKSNQLYN